MHDPVCLAGGSPTGRGDNSRFSRSIVTVLMLIKTVLDVYFAYPVERKLLNLVWIDALDYADINSELTLHRTRSMFACYGTGTLCTKLMCSV